MDEATRKRLAALDHAHVWHPFTPMRQWRQHEPLIIQAAAGDELIDARGNRYIDGIASVWCNVHGHRVPAIDAAIRDQLDRVAHVTMLGQANVPATELAARLAQIAPGELTQVFYSDSGATATEVAFKMAIGYWFHTGQPRRDTFIALSGAYHGDTTAAMSIGYSELFHRPFKPMVFHTEFVDPPRVAAARGSADGKWPLEDEAACAQACDAALRAMATRLDKLGDRCAGVVVEPRVQGAAGMVMQPPGYLAGVQRLCREHGTLLIADEVATGFGRTGTMFACEHEGVEPDLMALGKGITGGYLPLAATLATRRIAEAFEGELHEFRTLYHGHTYTGNPLAAAAALASLDLFAADDVLAGVRRRAQRLARRLDPLRDGARYPCVADVRQCGLMVGIELAEPGAAAGKSWLAGSQAPGGGSALGDFGETAAPDPPRRLGYDVCRAALEHGVIVRPLGDVVVLMPPLSINDAHLDTLAAVVVEQIGRL